MDIATIQKRLGVLEKCEQDIKNAKELLKGELENSLEYQEAVEVAKEANNKKKQIKDEILDKYRPSSEEILKTIPSGTTVVHME